MARFGLAALAALVLLLFCNAVEQNPTLPEPEVAQLNSPRTVQRIEFSAFSDLSKLVQDLNYTEKTWEAGQRVVPRLLMTRIPERFAEVTVKEVTVEEKKNMFFRMVLPLFLTANEEVEAEREKLLQIKAELAEKGILGADNLRQLRRLAKKYEVPMEGDVVSLNSVIETLERRVDIVPPSLGLAQAASESGWGTSRFAQEGNALFGQWTIGGKGMVPKEQRASKGDYKVARFKTPLASVRSYIRNLNTNAAYKQFRKRREAARSSGKSLSGSRLAKTLTKYSERGTAYVDDLLSIINTNRLSVLDRSYLADGDIYELLPVWRSEG